MKILSWNVNGIRSIYKKGFLNWFRREKPGILCLQEIKADINQIDKKLKNIKGYSIYINSARRKGYSGILVYSRKKPLKVDRKIGFKKFDKEGRFLRLNFKNFTLINIYLPHGGRKKERLNYKLNAYSYFFKYLKKLKNKNLIIIGDFNIAHKKIDLARPKQNKNNIMFTEKERKQIDKLIAMGFIDIYRQKNKNKKEYTWWPYFANARARNLGWRIDYFFISKKIKNKIKKVSILTKIKGSDHCPIKLIL